jgi:hypothetical protein
MSARPTEPDGGDDEARFRQSGAAALAAVLREKQDAPPQAPSVEETYRSLCYDDPIVSSSGCQALAQALGQQRPRKLALSNRLVHGVQHLCHRMTPASASAPAAPPSETETDEVPTSLLDPTTTGDASSAYAALAWVVYGQVPLRILLSDSLTEATSYLGSFRGSPAVSTEDSPPDEASENRPVEGNNPAQEEAPAVASSAEEGPESTAANIVVESEEVWATESDPSDFDFGTEPTQEERLAELEVWTSLLTVEPSHLSQSPADTTGSDVAHAVSDLLPQLAYNRLAGLSSASWNQWKLSESLTQLTLTLMLPVTLPAALVGSFPDNHWQQLALQPLHTFRDAVEVHSDALLEDFLQLIALLLQANHHAAPAVSLTASPSTTVAPATLVGLGTLSHLCTGLLEEAKNVQRGKRLTAVRDVVVRSADGLTVVLEQASGPSEASNMLSWTFLALWRVVSTHEPSHLSKAQAQILLQSGILRQWMIVWQKQQQAASSVLRTEIEGSLLYLCCAAPALLGKYTWRFADFAAHVTVGDDQSRTDALLLWNLVGAHLAELAGGATVVWKAKGAPALRPAPKASVCQEQAIAALQTLCSRLTTALTSWKERRSQMTDGEEEEEDSSDNVPEETLHAFESFDNVLDALSIPLVQTLFLKLQTSSADESLLVDDMIRPIKSLLVSWPSPKSHEDTKDNDVSDDAAVAKPDKPSDEEEPPKRRRGRVEVEDGLVASLRKSIKVLQSILETGQANDGPARFSSKAD